MIFPISASFSSKAVEDGILFALTLGWIAFFAGEELFINEKHFLKIEVNSFEKLLQFGDDYTLVRDVSGKAVEERLNKKKFDLIKSQSNAGIFVFASRRYAERFAEFNRGTLQG